jgi:hypothetical protein
LSGGNAANCPPSIDTTGGIVCASALRISTVCRDNSSAQLRGWPHIDGTELWPASSQMTISPSLNTRLAVFRRCGRMAKPKRLTLRRRGIRTRTNDISYRTAVVRPWSDTCGPTVHAPYALRREMELNNRSGPGAAILRRRVGVALLSGLTAGTEWNDIRNTKCLGGPP